MRPVLVWLAAPVIAMAVGCGGNVFVDTDGAAGSGAGGSGPATTSSSSSTTSTISTTTTTTTTSTSTPGLCEQADQCVEGPSGCGGCAVAGICKADFDACFDNQDCVDFLTCSDPCNGGDACQGKCVKEHPEGAKLLEQLASCVYCGPCKGICIKPPWLYCPP